jgi:filamentous hemagglutinin
VRASTGKKLAEKFGGHPKDYGRALEALKRNHGLPNNHHGKIRGDGAYLDSEGNLIDFITDYL